MNENENEDEHMQVLNTLNEQYPMCFDRYEELRDGGSTSYTVYSDEDKYFLRVIKPTFFDTAVKGAGIQVFLQNKDFPVPSIIRTQDGSLYVKKEKELYILYEYIEGEESDPEQDAETIGTLLGRLHRVMKDYPGELDKRDKHFFVGTYIDILQKKQYPKADEFQAYGEQLWDKIKGLPRGLCHGDMYSGNIHKAPDGKLYFFTCAGGAMND